MAAKRVTQVNINWQAVMERIAPAKLPQATAFKSKVDGYVRKMNAFPEKAPAIDWAYYKSRVGVPGMVDSFQKKYEALSIPFPTDTLTAKVEQEAKEKAQEAAELIKKLGMDIQTLNERLEHIRNTMPFSEMTMEDFQEAFPERALNSFARPSHWPHAPEDIEHGKTYALTGKRPANSGLDDSHAH